MKSLTSLLLTVMVLATMSVAEAAQPSSAAPMEEVVVAVLVKIGAALSLLFIVGFPTLGALFGFRADETTRIEGFVKGLGIAFMYTAGIWILGSVTVGAIGFFLHILFG